MEDFFHQEADFQSYSRMNKKQVMVTKLLNCSLLTSPDIKTESTPDKKLQ